MLRLHINEGSTPDPSAWAESLEESARFREYPRRDALERAIAGRLGVAAEQVLVTAGADDALDRCCRLALRGGGEAVVPLPGFETLLRLIEGAGGTIVDGADDVPRAIGERTRMVVLTTPDNPSGETTGADELERVADAVREADGPLLVVDNVYAEYTDEDPAAALIGRPEVVVVRTFSKAWGLAGCRVGYLIGTAERVAELRAIGNPYPVAGPSLAAALATLQGGEARLQRHVARVNVERERLSDRLASLGVPSSASRANFVWADFGERRAWVDAVLRSRGIRVRAFEGVSRLRISLPGDEPLYRRLEAALELALAPEAILFDMDGVLADVERSYREATIRSAASYGVTLTAEDVQRAVARGGANDDWELTRRLLAERGRDVPYDEVRARFQQVYLGEQLWRSERLTVPRAFLEGLALPLAVVTGRPREEARRFLESFEITDRFATVVCREDAALKPDPAPVRLALERLGVRRAWMLGDTPDDVRAATAAGAIAIGVIAPGDEAAASRRALTEAGAAVTFDSAIQLEEILP